MTLALIGATGQFGAATIDALLARGVDPSDILALGRNEARLSHLASRGLRTSTIDLANESATAATLSEVETLLLISVGAPGGGLAPRTAAIAAAVSAGVTHLVYTSALSAPTSTFILAAEHKATEEAVSTSGLPATFLRNGWFNENLQQDFETARELGVVANSIGSGRIASASRDDFAEAAAIVLTTPGHSGRAYELSGDEAWDYVEFAEAAAEILGRPVRYEAMTPSQEQERLAGAGLDAGTVGFLGMLNTGIRENALAQTSGELSRLLGRATTRLSDTLARWR